jgi:hypothetical protein
MTDVCCLLIGLLFTAGVVVVPFLMRNASNKKCYAVTVQTTDSCVGFGWQDLWG